MIAPLAEQIGYLLYVVIAQGGTIPTTSIIMLAAIYGLQALIFILRLRWDMIAWMLCKSSKTNPVLVYAGLTMLP